MTPYKTFHKTTLTILLLSAILHPLCLTAQTQYAEKIDHFLETEVEKSGFSGGILLIENGKTTLNKGYGLADKKQSSSFSSQTLFDVGSITKFFTATAILRLSEERKISLKAPISNYLDEVPAGKNEITIHHLLTHTAGFRGSLGFDYDPVSKQEFLEQAMSSELISEPGQSYHYSNVGYSLLAMIIEQVTGISYDRYVRENLFEPLDMNSTGYLPEVTKSRLAHGYRNNSKDWGTPWDHAWADNGPYWNLRGNGGLLTSLDDFEKWLKAYQNNSIITRESKKLQLSRHVPENPENTSYYGYGLAIFNLPEQKTMIGHDGSNMVFSADFQMYLAQDVSFLIVSNTHARRLFDISDLLSRFVITGELETLSEPAESTIKPIAFAAGHPAVKRILNFIEAINEGSKKQKTEFLNDNLSTDMVQDMGLNELLGLMDRIRNRHGKLKPVGVERADHQFTVYSETGNDNFLKLKVDHTGEPDFLIEGFILGMVDELSLNQK